VTQGLGHEATDRLSDLQVSIGIREARSPDSPRGTSGRFRRTTCRENGVEFERFHLPVARYLHEDAACELQAALPVQKLRQAVATIA